jgi:hypothetical protein
MAVAYRICVVGGWCSARMMMVAENLSTLLENSGFNCRVFHHSVWDDSSEPPACDLMLQLLQAFRPEDVGAAVINIRPFLVDLNDGPTMAKIMAHIEANHDQARPTKWDMAHVGCGMR